MYNQSLEINLKKSQVCLVDSCLSCLGNGPRGVRISIVYWSETSKMTISHQGIIQTCVCLCNVDPLHLAFYTVIYVLKLIYYGP